MSFFFNRNKPARNASFRLTEQGREKLLEFSGDAKSQILVALETRGSSDITEICHATGLSRGQVEKFTSQLSGNGFIQPTGLGESVE